MKVSDRVKLLKTQKEGEDVSSLFDKLKTIGIEDILAENLIYGQISGVVVRERKKGDEGFRYSDCDLSVRFGRNETWQIPCEWLTLAQPKRTGHHLTKIFK